MAAPRKDKAKRHPGGRPTLYKPEYCEMVVEKMAEGYTQVGFAGSIRVSEATIYNWANEHPEFFEALKIGKAVSAYYWETGAKRVAETGEGNAAMHIFGLKNRVPGEWRDRQEITGAGGGPVQTVDLSGLSDSALREILAADDDKSGST